MLIFENIQFHVVVIPTGQAQPIFQQLKIANICLMSQIISCTDSPFWSGIPRLGRVPSSCSTRTPHPRAVAMVHDPAVWGHGFTGSLLMQYRNRRPEGIYVEMYAVGRNRVIFPSFGPFQFFPIHLIIVSFMQMRGGVHGADTSCRDTPVRAMKLCRLE